MTIFSEELQDTINFAIARISHEGTVVTVTPDYPPYILVTAGKHTRKQKLGKFLNSASLEPHVVKESCEVYKITNSDTSEYTTSYSREYVEVYEHPLYAIDSTSKSCMTDNDSVRVYNYDDRLALLLLHKDNELCGRTLIRWDTNEYVRLYLDHNKIKSHVALALLAKAGFTKGNLEGIYLELEYDYNRVVMPYLDGVDNFNVVGDYIEVTRYGQYCAGNTNGYANIGIVCEDCDEVHEEDRVFYVEHYGRSVCECCLDDYIYFEDERSFILRSDCEYNNSTNEYVSPSYAQNNLCDTYNDGYYDWEDVVETYEQEWHPASNCKALAEEYNDCRYFHKNDSDVIYFDGDENIVKGYYVKAQLKELQEQFETEDEE